MVPIDIFSPIKSLFYSFLEKKFVNKVPPYTKSTLLVIISPLTLAHEKRSENFLYFFGLSRFLEPLITGEYPNSMRTRVGSRLPKFPPAESLAVKGSFDFIGINHYTTWYAKHNGTNIIGVLLNDTLADQGATTLRNALSLSLS